MRANPFSGSHSFQWKSFLLVEAIPSSGSHSFQQKPFFQWKPFILVVAVSFNGSHSFQWKPFLLHCVKSVQMQNLFWSVFSRIRIEYGEIRSTSPYSVRMRENKDQKQLPIWALFTQCQWKPFFSMEAIPFSGNHSLQWKPLLLVEAFFLVEVIHFSGSRSF